MPRRTWADKLIGRPSAEESSIFYGGEEEEEEKYGVLDHIRSASPIVARCWKCNKKLFGSYSFNKGRPSCPKHAD